MSPTRFLQIRKRRRETQVGFALVLGLHWTTVARYERGELRIPAPVSFLAQYLDSPHRKTKAP